VRFGRSLAPQRLLARGAERSSWSCVACSTASGRRVPSFVSVTFTAMNARPPEVASAVAGRSAIGFSERRSAATYRGR